MTDPTPTHGLGRVPSPEDPRDLEYPMRLALTALPVLPKYKYWPIGKVWNQGSSPHCVGFAWTQWMTTSPTRQPTSFDGDAHGHALYAICKTRDGIPNIDGTYVRVAAAVLKDQGRAAAYLWALTIGELKAWVLTKGPVVVGTNWYQAMFTPDSRGVLSVTGQIIGGHAWTLRGYSETRKQFRMVNSWGRSWGQNGEAWISEADVDRLVFREGGEAVTAVETVPGRA